MLRLQINLIPNFCNSNYLHHWNFSRQHLWLRMKRNAKGSNSLKVSMSRNIIWRFREYFITIFGSQEVDNIFLRDVDRLNISHKMHISQSGQTNSHLQSKLGCLLNWDLLQPQTNFYIHPDLPANNIYYILLQ